MKKEIKLWQPIVGFILTNILFKLNNNYFFYMPGPIWEILHEIIPILFVIWIVMFLYVFLRNIFRAIIGTVKKPKEP